MSAPLFLLPPDRLRDAAAGRPLLLDGPEGRHAADVTRVRVGAELLVADGEGTLARGRATRVQRGEVELVVSEVRTEPLPGASFTLVQALAKGDRDVLAVELATELGVDTIVPWAARRCVVVWRSQRATGSREKWVGAAIAAAKQSRRARVPQVTNQVDLGGLVQRVGASALTLVLHEEATLSLAHVDLPSTGEVILVVGPEGGVAPEELAALREAGGRPVRLGPTVLRTSTAGGAALAALSVRKRWQ